VDLAQATSPRSADGFGDSVGDGVEGSGRGFSDEAFDLGEDLLDRVEVG
jgi:hypothetical protein